MSAQPTNEVTYRIRRFDPNREPAPHWEEYRVPYAPGMTVLDGLWKIKETLSPTLAWRSSCRMGVCGSCGMLINGRPRLACNTQISELASTSVVVAPLPNFAIVRDLVPELSPMFATHQDLKPYVIRADEAEREAPTGEFFQSAHELEQYLQFTYCIKCGCCMAACPTFATDARYSGPMPLAQAHRYNTDSRDGGFAERREVLAGEAGPWRCHYAGECSRVCPKGVDPAKAIQLMKRELVLDYLRLHKSKCPAKVAAKAADAKRRDNIPDAPPRTV
ncbi:MAG TPA: succinate dehydrogenase/fumarate reductase iron-sulfur subunit [Thermoanaerobaculaceae bacterium]|nr:succinate dehydrogenase/fumarate reductase iron-sulfur subunit [Thermoanaerobaculaceae bacterium]